MILWIGWRSFKILERINVHEKVMSDAFLVWKNFNIRNGTAKGLTIDYVVQMQRVATRAVWDVQLLVNKNNNLISMFFFAILSRRPKFVASDSISGKNFNKFTRFYALNCMCVCVCNYKGICENMNAFCSNLKNLKHICIHIKYNKLFLVFFCRIFEKRKKFCTIEDTKSFFLPAFKLTIIIFASFSKTFIIY